MGQAGIERSYHILFRPYMTKQLHDFESCQPCGTMRNNKEEPVFW